jgi:multidrug efflux pump subunit AcrA (membrane-fusion protein)
VDIADPQGLLRPGMYADVELVLRRIPDALLVPESAVLDRAGQQIVFLVEGSEQGAVASARKVVPGLSSATEVQILSGIDLRDRVIVEGNSFLEEGQPIGVVENQ